MGAVTVIAPPCVDAMPLRQGKISGLAVGGAAIQNAGLAAQLEALGVRVTSVNRPTLPETGLTGNLVADLGVYNGQITSIVSAALNVSS